MDIQKLGAGTRATKTYLDGIKARRPLSIPITQAVNFEAVSSAELGKDFREGSPFVYQRFGHPTAQAAAEKIAALEGAEAALVFSSGMGAISTTLLALAAESGAHVVAQREIFAQTFTVLDSTLRKVGVETTFLESARIKDALKAALRPNTKLVYIESPSNPLLTIVDIEAIAGIAHAHKVPLLIDGTFASPYLQTPIALGADVVLHSGTKYLGGHSDVMCGAASGRKELISKIGEMQKLLGTVLDPHAAWLLLRGIKSLGVRVQRQADSALAIAQMLEKHPAVARVSYPWLESSPGYAVARKQMRGGGGMISFELKGGHKAATAFADRLQIISIATSLGGVESLIEIPYDLDFSEEELGEAAGSTGITPGLIRFSVGIEDTADLVTDLQQALAGI